MRIGTPRNDAVNFEFNFMGSILRKHITLIIGWGIVVGGIVAIISLVLPASYGAESAVLIISRDRSGVDPYTQAKSAEQVGGNLVQVLQTDDFFHKVMASAYFFDKERWNNFDDRGRRKNWHRDVVAAVVGGTSLLKITTYSVRSDDSLALARAVTETLAAQGADYVGGDIAFKVVDNPLLSPWLRRPNVILNTLGGFLVGMILAVFWLLRYKKTD